MEPRRGLFDAVLFRYPIIHWIFSFWIPLALVLLHGAWVFFSFFDAPSVEFVFNIKKNIPIKTNRTQI